VKNMAVFIGIHNLGGPKEDSLIKASWNAYKEACGKRSIKGIRVDYNAEKGIAHCITEANSEQEVNEAHQDTKMMPQEIFEIKTLE
jgi:hypothetical protein